MDVWPGSSDVLPPQMHDPVTVRDPVLPAAADHRVDRGAQARRTSRPSAHRRGPTCSRDAWASISMGLVSIAHQRVLERAGPARLRRALRLRRAVAPAGDRLVHVGDRHRRRRPAVLLLSPDRAPGPADLGDAPGAPLQPVLQLRHRAAAEVEQQRRRIPAGSAAAARRPAVDGVRQLLASTSSTSSGSTPSASARFGGPSSSSSTRRRTTACTTAWTRSTWTRTTAASSSCGTGCSAPSAARRSGRTTG